MWERTKEGGGDIISGRAIWANPQPAQVTWGQSYTCDILGWEGKLYLIAYTAIPHSPFPFDRPRSSEI